MGDSANLPAPMPTAWRDDNEIVIVTYETTFHTESGATGKRTVIGGDRRRTREFAAKCRRHVAEHNDRLHILDEDHPMYEELDDILDVGDERPI